jgi:hypothetical protein
MIKIENVSMYGLEEAIRGMRNPKNSWDRSDSGICGGGDGHIGCNNCSEYDCGHSYDKDFHVGKNDYDLMNRLASGGPVHAKYRRMIVLYLDITAPLYWWKEFDTYKVGTVANSCSTMHKIQDKEFTLDDFSHDHLTEFVPGGPLNGWTLEENDLISFGDDPDYGYSSVGVLKCIIKALNFNRQKYLEAKVKPMKEEAKRPKVMKKYWWQMIQLLPSSYNQKRTVMLNYEVLTNIYRWRKDHKLDEWRDFCNWIATLPYSELITQQEG